MVTSGKRKKNNFTAETSVERCLGNKMYRDCLRSYSPPQHKLPSSHTPQTCDSPDPRQGPESPFPGKEGFGVQKPPFPLVLEKGVFCQKSPFFSTRKHIENGNFWTENSLFQPCKGEGKWGFF